MRGCEEDGYVARGCVCDLGFVVCARCPEGVRVRGSAVGGVWRGVGRCGCG